MKKKQGITLAVAIAMILSGAFTYTNLDDKYFCPNRDLVMSCWKLSEGQGYRCYWNESEPSRWKACPGGWQDLGKFVKVNSSSEDEEFCLIANGENYCCVKDSGDYTKCISDSDREAYLGELL